MTCYAGDGGRFEQATHALDCNGANGDQQQHCIAERGQDRTAPQAIGMRPRRGASRQYARHPCHDQSEDVTKIVSRVRNERNRVCQ